MKKLAIAVAAVSLSFAAPVFACPDKAETRTAEKDKDTMKETKSAEKAKAAKDAEKAKAAKDAKPADKVSQR
jgi:hypothetical protein